MMIERIKGRISKTPKILFLVDGFGALLSAFFLGIVLVKLDKIFGIPHNTLYFLAALPCCFAIYDFYCFKNTRRKLGLHLKIIAFANLFYCCISIGSVIYHYGSITFFGLLYIILEIAIVITLVYFELNTANTLNSVQFE